MGYDFDNLSQEQAAELDALLGDRASDWWNGFYQDRAKPCPFFGSCADESLVQWIDQGLIRPGRALELGCGNGRNAILLARRGFCVDAVDHSSKAIGWATEQAAQAGVRVTLSCRSVFDLHHEPGTYDLVYDSGCFHHIPPHRRAHYVDLVAQVLRPGGKFGLACFTSDGGSGYSDGEVYERRSMGGGLGYSENRLRQIWSSRLELQVIRQMVRQDAHSGLFGESFLWALLARKP